MQSADTMEFGARQMPASGESSTCTFKLQCDSNPNQFALTEYIDIFNLVLEVILVVWPMTVFMGIQTNLRKRLVIAACFASRITYVPDGYTDYNVVILIDA